MATEPANLKTIAASFWWMPLVRGVLLIIMAIVMIAQPGTTLLTLIYFLGFYWVFGGLLSVIEGLAGNPDSKTWSIAGGALELLAGIFIIGHPLIAGQISALLFVYSIGALTIMAGLVMLINGFGIKQALWRVILGVLYMVFGVIILFNPVESVSTLIWLLPAWAILAGILSIVLAFQVKRIAE